MGYLPRAYRAPDTVHALRALVRQRGFFVRLGTATKCRIHGVCTALGAHTTTERPLHASGRIALTQGDHEELKDLYVTMDELEIHRIGIEKKIRATIKESETYKILVSIPGIGLITAATVLAEVGDFARFNSPSALVSYTGIYPRERSSAGKQHFGGMSKVGFRILRYTIIEAAMRVRDTDTSHNLYTHYDAARNRRKKTPKQAMRILKYNTMYILFCLYHSKNSSNPSISR